MAETKTNIPFQVKMGAEKDSSGASKLPSFEEGSLIITTDTKKVYVDPVDGDERIAVGGVEPDSELSSTSVNPVQNKVITNALVGKQDNLQLKQITSNSRVILVPTNSAANQVGIRRGDYAGGLTMTSNDTMLFGGNPNSGGQGGTTLYLHTNNFEFYDANPRAVSGEVGTHIPAHIIGVATPVSQASTDLDIDADIIPYQAVNKKYVDDSISTQISSVYKAKGSVTFSELPKTLTSAQEGFVYNISEEFTTTALFIEGAGKTYPSGTNVVVVKDGNTYKYDVLAGMIDLSDYATKTYVDDIVGDINTILATLVDVTTTQSDEPISEEPTI